MTVAPKNPRRPALAMALLALALTAPPFPAQAGAKGCPLPAPDVLVAARPNPYNRGNCFQWKKCLGETIGNMWVDAPEFCGPLGGKSWKGRDGVCRDLMEAPWEIDPRNAPPIPKGG
ncbi:MAG: hypothetical protein LBF58_00905 [Deltaproteobacteria bacterium]|jgi:hypothetical protein|nr:hypothetical protein [Deltaproteobacteria bacterium]